MRKPTIYTLSTIFEPRWTAARPACYHKGTDRQEAGAMDQREKQVRQWFDMWLTAQDTGITALFTPDCVYTESWGPQYHGAAQVKHWFDEWNTRGRVLVWDIRQFFHQGGQTVAEWHFCDRMHDGRTEEFYGMLLIRWAADSRIAALTEFGCNVHTYDPYADGPVPRFRDETISWF